MTAPNTDGDKPKRASLITRPASSATTNRMLGSAKGADQDIHVRQNHWERFIRST
jgi:hypothetical protein